MFSQALCKIPGSSSVKLPKAMIFFSFVSSAFHVCPMLRSAHWGVKSNATGIPVLRMLIMVISAVSKHER